MNAVIAAMQENCLEKPTIITVQGALVNQVNDIINGLNKNKDTDWKYFGYGADDGAEAGEFNPIIYDSNEWTLESGSQVWISPTPDEPSLFPGATQKRTFTMATFKHNSRRIRIINGQFDDEIDEARDFGARFIELYARKSMQDGYLTIVTGGINSAKGSYPHELFTKNLSDCSKKFSPRYSTYSSFSIIRGETMDLETIDFVFVDARSIATMNYQVIDNISDGLFRFSDHRPVIADLFI
ncbi:uncharacterized protein J8A68_001194 [[Candida] subhashii]|uniref:Endonuclease/exonuclease/phosphatase domain-containing protein n=1 Tax=[Candida] subhashii TaxID=561895 RepID=A0A8J5QRK0_9ASCO|nr:uncharacterized protein J8A68_001194 [[Candida] subhashii]KAG7665138.1 hypothetical protein J8A68_001194 [[Candida] subhashii]